MKKKLDVIKWAVAHLDETFLFGGGEYRIVGAGFNGFEWVAIGKGVSGWSTVDFDDCILSDIPEGDFNNFKYINIECLCKQGKKV